MSENLNMKHLKSTVDELGLDLVLPRDFIYLHDHGIHLYCKVFVYDPDCSKTIYVDVPMWILEEIGEEKHSNLRSFNLEVLENSNDEIERHVYGCEFENLYFADNALERMKKYFTKDGRESAATKVEDFKNVAKILAIAIHVLEKEIKADSKYLNKNTGKIIIDRLVGTISKEKEFWNGKLSNKTSYDIEGPVGHLARETVKRMVSWAKDYSKY